MGVTIFYSGRLRSMADLPELIQAVQAQASQLGWPYQMVDERIVGTGERRIIEDIETDDGIPTFQERVIEEPLDDYWRGIVVRPPQCESLFLTFNRHGALVQYGLASSDDDIGHYGIIYTPWCKTQFGPSAAHIGVCQLLRLVASYAADWEVIDEGGYYDTGDQEELERRRGKIDAALRLLADEVKNTPDQASEARKGAHHTEIGKVIKVEPPAWRETWSDEHNEN